MSSKSIKHICINLRVLDYKYSSGFTIVELIVAIVLVGILATVTISRFLDSDVYNANIIQSQIISLARTAQQSALGRSDVSLAITPVAGDQVTLTTSETGGTIASFTVSLRSVTLTGDINDTDSCAVTSGAFTISNSTPMVLNFGELGDLESSGVTGNQGAITSAVRICINDSATDSVCVSPSGFAYAGDCDV